MTDNAAWLAQTSEKILEPELPICDPHHHLWDHPGSRYLFDELLEDLAGGHRVVSTVHVEAMSMYRAAGPEAMRSVGETEFINGVAAMSASGGYGECRVAAGIVGFADLTLGAAVEEVLHAHLAASGRFRGIRHASGWDEHEPVRDSHTSPPRGLLSDRRFREGFARLAKNSLSFDAWLYHLQISELTALARAFPETRIVLDHFGGPLGIGPYAGRREDIFEVWKRDIAELARCSNVFAKLGGVLMKINGFGLHNQDTPPGSERLAELTAPYHLHAIECFGVQRCMFESNFPVDKVSCSYSVLWNSFKRIAADFSADEKAALFHDTAVDFYRL